MLPALWLGELKSQFLFLLFLLTYSSLFHVIVLLSPAVLPKCTPFHPGWEPDVLSVFWLINPYSLFSSQFLPRISEDGKMFFVKTAVLYQTCFSDNSTPPAAKDVFSVPVCPSELAQTGQSVLQKHCLDCVCDHILRLCTYCFPWRKKANFIAKVIHLVE